MAFICEDCWRSRGYPRYYNRLTKVNPGLICYDCGVEPGILYVKVK